MRVLIDVPDELMTAWRALAERQRVPVSTVICDALRASAEQQRVSDVAAGFGLWGSGEDELAYQQRMREE